MRLAKNGEAYWTTSELVQPTKQLGTTADDIVGLLEEDRETRSGENTRESASKVTNVTEAMHALKFERALSGHSRARV